jgi:triosephosphate isomerase (TIM)
MSRRPFIAGNWKMNTRRSSAIELIQQLIQGVGEDSIAEVAVCPPNVYLVAAADALAGSSIELGAQNLYPAGDGAYTGEVNAAMLTDVGCRFVILGHSERRQLFGETDASVAEKLQAALAGNLVPIVCVGETLQQRKGDETEAVVESQIRGSLEGLDEVRAAGIVVAYEPVWAIGTGLTATPDQAEAVHAMIRKLLGEMYTPEIAGQIRIQYGGSVKADNAADLLGQPNIDGALVGGASLKAGGFLAIVAAASEK